MRHRQACSWQRDANSQFTTTTTASRLVSPSLSSTSKQARISLITTCCRLPTLDTTSDSRHSQTPPSNDPAAIDRPSQPAPFCPAPARPLQQHPARQRNKDQVSFQPARSGPARHNYSAPAHARRPSSAKTRGQEQRQPALHRKVVPLRPRSREDSLSFSTTTTRRAPLRCSHVFYSLLFLSLHASQPAVDNPATRHAHAHAHA